ncbi:MAG: LLM class flavin-dependent oxidoreductase [Thermomicrobiales bacterium]
MGAEWNRPDFEPFGFPFDHRVGRFEEAFTIIRTLLSDGEIDFHGAYYDLPNCILTPNGPRGGDLPLLVGSIGERMLRATLPYVGTGMLVRGLRKRPHRATRRVMAEVDRIAEDGGRDPASFSRNIAVLVGRSGRRIDRRSIPRRASVPFLVPPARSQKLNAFYDEGVDHVQIVPQHPSPSRRSRLLLQSWSNSSPEIRTRLAQHRKRRRTQDAGLRTSSPGRGPSGACKKSARVLESQNWRGLSEMP